MSHHPLETQLADAWPPAVWRDVTVLLAVSGGADSVALLRAMARLKTAGKGRLAVAHFNHQWRGAESAADTAFVVSLSAELGLECQAGSAEANADRAPDGLEAAARTLRYGFFRQTAERLGARYVVTAHTADDQAETILHRILRGTGVAGLSGIGRVRALGPAVSVIRPMLGIRRADIDGYLSQLGQPHRRDSSNLDLRFTRNRIRAELLPHLAANFNPRVADALTRLGALAAEVQTVIDALVEDLMGRYVQQEGLAGLRIDAAGLAAQPRYLVRELVMAAWRRQGWPLQAMGLAEWNQLADMLSATAGPLRPQMFPGSVTASAADGALRLRRESRLGGTL